MQEKRLSKGKDSNMKRIACLGDSCVDRYDTGEVFPGGNPVNVAVYINRLGGAASFIGAVGSDAYAELLLTPLAQKGIDVSHVQRLSGSTPIWFSAASIVFPFFPASKSKTATACSSITIPV